MTTAFLLGVCEADIVSKTLARHSSSTTAVTAAAAAAVAAATKHDACTQD